MPFAFDKDDRPGTDWPPKEPEGDRDAGRLWDAVVVATYLAMVLGAVVALAWCGEAHARWSPGAAERIREQAPMILAAAQATGTDPVLLAAIAAHETQAQAVAGGSVVDGEPCCWGQMQVAWRWWGDDLAEVGIARRPEELLDPGVGWLAGAFVLAEKRRRYRPRTEALWLCVFGVGADALRFERDCLYSREVQANLRRAERALWGRP